MTTQTKCILPWGCRHAAGYLTDYLSCVGVCYAKKVQDECEALKAELHGGSCEDAQVQSFRIPDEGWD